MAPRVTRARAVSVDVTNRTRRYTRRHEYSHLRGLIILLKFVLGSMAQSAVLANIKCNTKLASVLFIPILEAATSIQVFKTHYNDLFVHATCPLYSVLDLISFMIFGESCKLESFSMRCFFPPMLLRVIPHGCVKCTETVGLFVLCVHYYSFFAQESRTHKLSAKYCSLQRPVSILVIKPTRCTNFSNSFLE